MGRPSDYSQEIATEVCARLVSSGPDGGPRSLRSVCRDKDMPEARSIFRWLAQHEEFSQQYARACEARSDADAEDIREIAESTQLGVIRKLERQFVPANNTGSEKVVDPDGFTDGAPPAGSFEMVVVEERQQDMLEHRKLQIDTRKWLMERMHLRKYGPRQRVDHGVTGTLETLITASMNPAGGVPALPDQGQDDE